MHTQGLSLLLIVFASMAANGAPLQRRDHVNELDNLDRRALGKAKPISKPISKPIPKPVVSPPKPPVVAPPKPPVAPPKTTPPAPPKTTAAPPPKTTAAPPPKTTAAPPAKTTAKSTTSAAATTSQAAACPVRKPAAKAPAAKAPAPKPLVGRAKGAKPALLCGVPLRTAVAGSCQGKKRFTFSGGLLKTLNSRAGDSGDEFVPDSDDELEDDHDFDDDEETDGTEQCDHVLELQVLKKTLEANGACKALDAIVKAGKLTAAERATVVNPLVDAVNDKKNLFFLDSTLNLIKAKEVNRGLGAAKGALFDKTDLDELAKFKAVEGYLTTQVTASKKLATDLDTATTKMINDAAALANSNIPCSGLAQKAQTDALAAVKKAQTGFKGTSSVATAWNNVLAFVTKQAA